MQDQSQGSEGSNPGTNPTGNALQALKRVLEKRQAFLSEALIQMGPDELRKYLKLTRIEWNRLYRSLISTGALRRLVLDYMPFFVELTANRGPKALRSALRLEPAMFDGVSEEILELVGISQGGLYEYVDRNRDGLSSLIMQGAGKSIRGDLGIMSPRYDRVWGDILERLTGAVCETYSGEHMISDGLQSFSMLMNTLRTHRSLRSFRQMWEYETAR